MAVKVHDNYESFFPADVHYIADHAVRAMSSFPYAENDYYGIPYHLDNPVLPFRSEVWAIVNRGAKTGRMVKNENFRYVEWDNGNMGNELYDQKTDPVEYNNLANNPAYAGVVAEMKKMLDQKQ